MNERSLFAFFLRRGEGSSSRGGHRRSVSHGAASAILLKGPGATGPLGRTAPPVEEDVDEAEEEHHEKGATVKEEKVKLVRRKLNYLKAAFAHSCMNRLKLLLLLLLLYLLFLLMLLVV